MRPRVTRGSPCRRAGPATSPPVAGRRRFVRGGATRAGTGTPGCGRDSRRVLPGQRRRLNEWFPPPLRARPTRTGLSRPATPVARPAAEPRPRPPALQPNGSRRGPASRAARCAWHSPSSCAANGRRTGSSPRSALRPPRARAPGLRCAAARAQVRRAPGAPNRSNRCLCRENTAVVELDRALHARSDVGVVRRDDKREPKFTLYGLQQVEHALTGVRIEVTRRLVAEQ